MSERDPYNLEAIRDLLGVCRALHAAEQAGQIDPVRLYRLHDSGEDLERVIVIGRQQPKPSEWRRVRGGIVACSKAIEEVAKEIELYRAVKLAASRAIRGQKS